MSESARARGRLGMSLARGARLIGTSAGNLSTYEAGRKPPGALVASRIAQLCRLSPSSRYVDTDLLTMPRLAVDLKGLLREGDEASALRWVAQAVADRERLTDIADVWLFLAEPSTTGDRRWDALLAGVAEREAHRAGVDPPDWCRKPGTSLPWFWWLVPSPGLSAFALVNTPVELKARGVLLPAIELTSV